MFVEIIEMPFGTNDAWKGKRFFAEQDMSDESMVISGEQLANAGCAFFRRNESYSFFPGEYKLLD